MALVLRNEQVGPAEARRRPSAARPSSAARIVLLYLASFLVVATVIFLLPRSMPGDPLATLTDPNDAQFVSDPAARERTLAYYGLDRSLAEQYQSYLARLARGDLGWSISRNVPVSTLLRTHLPWTALLMGTALLLSSLLSFLGGVTAAWHRGQRRDRVLVTVMVGLRAVPEYALGAVLLVLFAVLIPIFPLSGARSPFAEQGSIGTALDIAQHLALPALALTLSLMGTKFLLVRNTMMSALGQEYMTLARAKGLPRRRLQYSHAGRNALLPFLTVLGIQTGVALGGSIFIETVFAYPGMGTLVMRALNSRDYPVLEGSFLVLGAVVLLANLVVDLVYRHLDPAAASR